MSTKRTARATSRAKQPKKLPLTPAEQHARFVEAAKRAEVDDAPDAMEKAFKRLDPRKTQSDP